VETLRPLRDEHKSKRKDAKESFDNRPDHCLWQGQVLAGPDLHDTNIESAMAKGPAVLADHQRFIEKNARYD